jgi:hypothetical protein
MFFWLEERSVRRSMATDLPIKCIRETLQNERVSSRGDHQLPTETLAFLNENPLSAFWYVVTSKDQL